LVLLIGACGSSDNTTKTTASPTVVIPAAGTSAPTTSTTATSTPATSATTSITTTSTTPELTTPAPTTPASNATVVVPDNVTSLLAATDPDHVLDPIRDCFNQTFEISIAKDIADDPRLFAAFVQDSAQRCGLILKVLINPVTGTVIVAPQ
jgi:hypothetical protein